MGWRKVVYVACETGRGTDGHFVKKGPGRAGRNWARQNDGVGTGWEKAGVGWDRKDMLGEAGDRTE